MQAPSRAGFCTGNWSSLSLPVQTCCGFVHTERRPSVCMSVSLLHFLPEASFGLRVLSLPASVCVCPSLRQSWVVRAITHHPFQPGSPNLDQRCKTLVKIPIVLWNDWSWPSRSNWTPKSKFTPFWVCPCHNSPPNEVTISKFGTKMHLSTVQIPTNFGLDWNWSSIQFLISNQTKLSFLCTSLAFFSETS